MRRPIIAILSGLALTSPAFATDDAGPNFAEDTLTGDWGGTRSAAAKRGFIFEGLARVDALRNRGAIRNGSRHVTHLDLKLKMDLEKAAGWNGGSAMVNVLSNGSWGPNAQLVGAQMGVTNIEVNSPTTTRLFQAWLQQSLFDDRLAFLAGLYPIDSEFFTVDSAGVFIGPQYGTPADLAQTRTPSIFNNSAFGLRAKWNVTKTVYAMGAVLDGIPNDPARPRATAIRFAKGDGSFSIGELGWLPEAENDKFKGHAKAAIGVWGYSAKVNDQLDNALRRHQGGGYVLGERTLARLGGSEERFLSGFARYTWTDGDSTAVKNSLNLGLHARGPVASRPDDVVGFAWTRAGMAQKWRDVQTVPGDTKTSETALEITYRYAVTPYFAIQPNYQYIRHPGGASAPNAKLIGVRLDLAL
jgi:porin